MAQGLHDSQEDTLLALGVLAILFANLAQQALDKEWIRFRRGSGTIGGGEIDTRPFRTSTKIFSSKQLYDYLDWKQKIPAECPGQRERAVLKRLASAKELVEGDARPSEITRTQLHWPLTRAVEAFATREESIT